MCCRATTALLAAGFFATSLMLSWLAGFQRHPTSIINTGGTPAQERPRRRARLVHRQPRPLSQ